MHCVFVCGDLPFQYVDDYFAQLGAERFRPVRNEALRHVDLYRYDNAWERDAADALPAFFTLEPLPDAAPRPGTQVLDFRRAADFAAVYLPGSANLPLAALRDGAELWRELDGLFADADADASGLVARLRAAQQVLTLCYDGDCARVANSVLRARGGFAALAHLALPRAPASQPSSPVVSVEA